AASVRKAAVISDHSCSYAPVVRSTSQTLDAGEDGVSKGGVDACSGLSPDTRATTVAGLSGPSRSSSPSSITDPSPRNRGADPRAARPVPPSARGDRSAARPDQVRDATVPLPVAPRAELRRSSAYRGRGSAR